MRNKLKANKDHFPTEELRIAYIESRVSEAAAKHIASRMRDISLNSFLEVEDVLSMINKMYDDLNRRHTAQRQYFYIVLRQKGKPIVCCQDVHQVTQHQNFFDPALCFLAVLTRASRFFPFKLPSFSFLSIKLPL